MGSAFRYKTGTIANRLMTKVTVSCGNNSLEVAALWDTGATICCVSKDVINKLSLIPSGVVSMSTPSSTNEQKDIFLVDLTLPNNILIKDVMVADSQIGSQGIGLLVGMNIISKGDLLITNTGETVFSFRMPPEPLSDFVTGIDLRNIIGQTKNTGAHKGVKRRKR